MSASPLDEHGREFFLKGGPSASRDARQAVLEANGFLPTTVRDDLLLLVTELVSNAVRHGGVGPEESVQVALRLRDDVIRVEVIDPGTTFTRADAPARPSDTGGWGLFIVDRLAIRWGVTPADGGTCVWGELAAER